MDPSAHLDPIIYFLQKIIFLSCFFCQTHFGLRCILEVSMSYSPADDIKTFPLDHHGIVAAICKDLKIAERINSFIPVHEKRTVSPGHAVVAMIINGLGFTDRRLYLTSQFFESKPVEQLLDAPIQASDLTDYTLGHTLDDIFNYGATELFAQVAFGIGIENGLLGNLNHLDTTTFNVSGQYDSNGNSTKIENGEPTEINLTYGHSKDHRPDLKQVVLSLVVNGPSSMPLWMEALDGNSSDKSSFHTTIKNMRKFKKQLAIPDQSKWVADSALYSKTKLLASNEYLWVTRVPETILEAKEMVSQMDDALIWQNSESNGEDGKKSKYRYSSSRSFFGGIEQRWLLVFSEHAYEKEKKTFEKNLKLLEEQLIKDIWHLSKQHFGCTADAYAEAFTIKKKYPLFNFMSKISEKTQYKNAGKPKQGEKPDIVGYEIELVAEKNLEEIEKLLRRKGRFIIASNDLDEDAFPDEQMLREYKAQQNVERGFRFLKDPWFMVDSVFLKSRKRIASLMMVMTLCLLVYNVGQYLLRKKLKEDNETLPNQLGKGVQNITMRWVFQCMEGIGIAKIYDPSGEVLLRAVVTNLTEVRRKMIRLMGDSASQMYGLIPKSAGVGLGM